MCCGAKVSTFKRGVTIACDGVERQATSQAEILARRFGVNLCDCAATGIGGNLIIEQDVLRKAGRL